MSLANAVSGTKRTCGPYSAMSGFRSRLGHLSHLPSLTYLNE
jgi:hypothetical protein